MVRTVPRDVIGKILKSELRQMFADRCAGQSSSSSHSRAVGAVFRIALHRSPWRPKSSSQRRLGSPAVPVPCYQRETPAFAGVTFGVDAAAQCHWEDIEKRAAPDVYGRLRGSKFIKFTLARCRCSIRDCVALVALPARVVTPAEAGVSGGSCPVLSPGDPSLRWGDVWGGRCRAMSMERY